MRKLAIIVPFYKIDFFERTVRSLKEQTDKNFSLYVGNDASSSDPIPILASYFKRDEFKYFNYDVNLGKENLARQWMRIYNNIDEEWFQILGDDDVLSNNFVEVFNKIHISNDVNFIKVRNFWIDEEDSIIHDSFKNLKSGLYDVLDFAFKKINYETNSSLSEHLFRSSAFNHVGFREYPLAWNTDDMLLLEISNLGQFLYVSESFVSIRVHDKSISGSAEYETKKNKSTKLYFADMSSLILSNAMPFSVRMTFLNSLFRFRGVLGDRYIVSSFIQHGFFTTLMCLFIYFRKIVKLTFSFLASRRHV